MGQCTSKNNGSGRQNGVFNQMKKSDRQLRSGVKFKDIEFGGFIGYSTVINDVYTPSRVKRVVECLEEANPTEGGDGDEPLIPK